MAEQKKTRRSAVKYPGLDKTYTTRKRREYLDQDYIDKLSEEEKDWLNRFNEEYVNANMNHKGEKFHTSEEDVKKIWGLNNAKNRDALATAREKGKLFQLPDIANIVDRNSDEHNLNPEEALIRAIDATSKSGVKKE